jgi:hypothetical protein
MIAPADAQRGESARPWNCEEAAIARMNDHECSPTTSGAGRLNGPLTADPSYRAVFGGRHRVV